MRVRVHREPVAMRRKCPDVLRKYGWCGVLALHYALNLSMPNSEAEFTARLFALRTIISAKLPRWKPSTKPSRRGGITTTHTETVLSHYRDTCTYTLDRFVERRMTVNAWLKSNATKSPYSQYIVHTGRHSVFVDVPKRVTKWVLYDQGGPQTRAKMPLLNAKGKVGRQQIKAVFNIITPPKAADSPRGP